MRVLAVTGGHRVDLDAFTGMLAGICAERGWVFAHAVQPAAQDWLGRSTLACSTLCCVMTCRGWS